MDLRSLERITLYRRKSLGERASTPLQWTCAGFLNGLVYALVQEGFDWKYLAGATAVGASAGALLFLDAESPGRPILVRYEVAY